MRSRVSCVPTPMRSVSSTDSLTGLILTLETKPKAVAAPIKVPEQEFGGPLGAVFIMITSHLFLFAMAASLYGWDLEAYVPTPRVVGAVLAYQFSQFFFAWFMPGVYVLGESKLGYLCNAYSCFYLTIFVAMLRQCTGVFQLTTFVAEYPRFLTTSVVLADIYSVALHLWYARGEQIFSVYDFFMGIGVHPRFGPVDIKMVAETRVSWTLLFLVAMGGYIETASRVGSWANPGAFMVFALFLYANACAKGEHYIPYTWDITVESFGWMLCWWNLAGVPMLYCYQSLFIAKHAEAGLLLPPVPQWLYYGVCTVLLVLAYCIWDEANYNKCYFKLEQRGELIKRNLFPTFRHVKNPKYIQCGAGKLLIDGWYGVARKVHYVADASMALLWGLSCGFSSPLPYVYVAFFVVMITHRTLRDEARCAKKYGEAWEKYLQAVPYRFIYGLW